MRAKVALQVLSIKCTPPRMFFTPGLELCPAGLPLQGSDDVSSNSLADLVNGIWLMAAPKSKVINYHCRLHLYIPMNLFSSLLSIIGYEYEEEEKAH